MQMSASGRAQLIAREGFKTTAYRDTKGIWTIGVGHTSAAGAPEVTPGLKITRAEVDAILTHDLRKFEFIVGHAVTVPLMQGQFDALVSLCFNIGGEGFRKSTVVKLLNAGNYVGAADAFLLWNKPREIIGRRQGERKQFLAATSAHATGEPVRFFAADDLHDGEEVTPNYLRAAGSRIMTAAGRVKKIALTVAGGDALSTLSQAKEYADQARDLAHGFSAGAPTAELLESYAPLFLALGVALLVVVLALVAWAAAHKIEAARVEDAVA